MAKFRKRQNGETPASDAAQRNDESTRVGTFGLDAADAGNYGDRVAMRAYELYLARGASDGRDFDDWLTAERELTAPRDDDRQD